MTEPSAPVRRRAAIIAAVIAYATMVGVTVRTASLDTDWNFDAVPYVAVAFSLSDRDPESVHRNVYDELRAAVPDSAFQALTAGSEYRKALHSSPVALATQRSLYVNKPAYVAAIAALHGLGINGFRATRIISVGAFAALAIIVLLWLRAARSGPLHVLAAGLLLVSRPIVELASLSTPDGACIVPLALGGWLIVSSRRHALGIAIATSAIAFRPDAAIMVMLLAGWATFYAPERTFSRRVLAIAATAIFVGTLLLQKLLGATSIPVLLHHVFEARLYAPEHMNDAITVSGYFSAIRKGLGGYGLYRGSELAVYLLVSAVAIIGVVTSRREVLKPFGGWVVLVWSYVAIHFVVLPDPSDRYFAPTYLLATLGAICYAFSPRPRSSLFFV
jgi:hypothetical protein